MAYENHTHPTNIYKLTKTGTVSFIDASGGARNNNTYKLTSPTIINFENMYIFYYDINTVFRLKSYTKMEANLRAGVMFDSTKPSSSYYINESHSPEITNNNITTAPSTFTASKALLLPHKGTVREHCISNVMYLYGQLHTGDGAYYSGVNAEFDITITLYGLLW